jgi:hypothetical protein
MGRTKFSEAGPKRRNTKSSAASLAAKNGFDGLTDAPWRKTPSIFKQPVTLVRTSSTNKKMPEAVFVNLLHIYHMQFLEKIHTDSTFSRTSRQAKTGRNNK